MDKKENFKWWDRNGKVIEYKKPSELIGSSSKDERSIYLVFQTDQKTEWEAVTFLYIGAVNLVRERMFADHQDKDYRSSEIVKVISLPKSSRHSNCSMWIAVEDWVSAEKIDKESPTKNVKKQPPGTISWQTYPAKKGGTGAATFEESVVAVPSKPYGDMATKWEFRDRFDRPLSGSVFQMTPPGLASLNTSASLLPRAPYKAQLFIRPMKRFEFKNIPVYPVVK